MATSVDDPSLYKIEREDAAQLAHKRKLLRVKNQLCSPLLRLPTEIILRILLLVMAELDTPFGRDAGRPIYSTCHRLHKIMCSATELWWRVDFTYPRIAHFIFSHSNGDPEIILSNLRWLPERQLPGVEEILDYWRDKLEFKGHRLHTLEFRGPPSTFSHFSWMLERPLPRVERLKIHIVESIDDEFMEPFPGPVSLELPAGMPLQALDLRNAGLSWSSHFNLFNGLRELHLNFRDSHPMVTIPDDELFGIFDASPQLEHLSLVQVGREILVVDNIPLPPKRILQFPHLESLSLDNDPVVIKYTLEYMELPVIKSLKIRSSISWEVAQILVTLFFPDDRLPTRLFPNPPTFAVRLAGVEAESSIEIDIGSVTFRLDFPFGEGELGRNSFMPCIPQLVPPSTTTLNIEYTDLEERGWREFFASHPEVRLIECTEFYGVPVCKSLWNALSPAVGEGTNVLCPRLESISITAHTNDIAFTPLSDCLQNRKTSGFPLKHLRLLDYHGSMGDMSEFHGEFDPLVETVEAGNRFNTRRGWGRSHLGLLEERDVI